MKTAEALKPGELKIDEIGKFKLLPNQAVQDYVAAIGRSLIPAYQSGLAVDDPRRIPFQFHVVLDDEANAFATPNGIVVVHSGLIELLDNEAQLAAVIGHEIAHSTHEHTWRQRQHHKKKRLAIGIAGAVAAAYGLDDLADVATLVNAAVVNGHQRSLENQSDRVGLEYMVRAGYDPREAPAVWKLMAKKYGVQAHRFLLEQPREPGDPAQLSDERVEEQLQDLDYSGLKVNAEEFGRMKAEVVNSKSTKRKLKVR